MLSIKLLQPYHSFQSNTYLISSADKCAVVDPSVPFNEAFLEGDLEYIILTHAHFDHMLDIDDWVASTNAKVVVLEDEAGALSDPTRNCYRFFDGSNKGYFGDVCSVTDGEEFPLSDYTVKVIACPGHTIGCATYIIDNYAFVGDIVFEGGGYGRVDLPTGNMTMLRDSILKILSLPEDTILLPGHGNSTTVKQYKQDIGR